MGGEQLYGSTILGHHIGPLLPITRGGAKKGLPMIPTETSVNSIQAGAAEPLPLILIVSIIIALVAALFGFLWLRHHRANKRHGHLDADIALPETMAEAEEKAGQSKAPHPGD